MAKQGLYVIKTIETLLSFTHFVGYRCPVVGQVIQDTTAGQHRQSGVQGVPVFLPGIISSLIRIFLSSFVVLFLFNLTLFVTAFILFQLRTEADTCVFNVL